MDWVAVLSGFGIGAIVGMTGVGGGSLMTPLLIGVFRLSPAVAIGTDLFFAAITKSGGAWAHARHGHVDKQIVFRLLAGSLPAAVATIAAMHFTGITKAWAGTLTFSLGIALLVTAVTVAYRSAWHGIGLKLQRWLPESRKPAITVAAGGCWACWSRSVRSAPARSASPCSCCCIPRCRPSAWSAPTSPTPFR